MVSTALHYIYDPLCAWCYGASRHVAAAQNVSGLKLVLHGIGLYPYERPYPSANASPVDNFVAESKKRYAQIQADTGVTISADAEATIRRLGSKGLDSSFGIAAVLAAEQVSGHGADLLHHLLAALFGKADAAQDPGGLVEHAARIGIRRAAFAAALDASNGAATQEHIRATRALLAEVKGDGVPYFILEKGSKLEPAPIKNFRDPDAWIASVK